MKYSVFKFYSIYYRQIDTIAIGICPEIGQANYYFGMFNMTILHNLINK